MFEVNLHGKKWGSFVLASCYEVEIARVKNRIEPTAFMLAMTRGLLGILEIYIWKSTKKPLASEEQRV